jgi:flagellin-like protein
MKKDKKGVSPVVATVLLVAVVIVLAAIIFLWARSFFKESVYKFVDGKELSGEQACTKLSFEASKEDSTIAIKNTGNVPINAINVKVRDGGSTTIEHFEVSLNIGDSTSEDVSGDAESIIPLILAKGKKNTLYLCDKQEYAL